MGDSTQRGLHDFRYFEIEQVVTLEAPPARVFEALTGDLSNWWGAPYLMAASAKRVVLEPHPGGRLLECWSEKPQQCEEEGALWGVVQDIADAELIVLTGAMGMPWPTMGQVTFEFKPYDDSAAGGQRCVLTLRHQAYGPLSEAVRDHYEYGWADLLNRRLRQWIERGEPCGIGHEPLPWIGYQPPEE
jgi:uncharacterized protein YndB with AHSA1/START domain